MIMLLYHMSRTDLLDCIIFDRLIEKLDFIGIV